MKNVTKKAIENVTCTDRRKICGERLRACRERMHLTQEELIGKVENLPENNGKDRNEKQIGYIENGKRALSAEYALLLGKVLGVEPAYLLGESDYETVAAQFSSAIDKMNQEGNLLYTGLCAFAMLTDYHIEPPKLSEAKSLENYFTERKKGYRITKDKQTVMLSPEELNRFENEVCDFVELKLIHLFKQKAGVKNGNSK